MTNFRNAMMAAAHTASGPSVVSVGKSALFDSANSEYLSQTFSTPTDQDVFTFSTWLYRGLQGILSGVFAGAATNQDVLYFNSTANTLKLILSGSTVFETSMVFRDIGWYHIVWKKSGTSATLYVNGVSVATGTGTVNDINTAVAHTIGSYNGAANYYNGYIAESVFIDGLQLAPTSFGQYDSTGTFWTPKSSAEIKALTFGNNGFYLDNTTNAQTDASGNGNNFTNNNTVVTDTHTPTNIEFLMSPINVTDPSDNPVLSNGNRTYTASSAGAQTRMGGNIPFPSSGKWLQGVSLSDKDNGKAFAVWTDRTDGDGFPNFGGFLGWHLTTVMNGYNSSGSSPFSLDSNFTTSDQFWIAVDIDNSKVWLGFYDDSASTITWYAADGGTDGNPATGDNPFESIDCSGAVFAGAAQNSKAFTLVKEADCPFTIPTGYSFLSTTNLAANITRTHSNLEEYFDSTLYEGTGSEQNVVSDTTTNTSAFSWIKNRDAADNHMLFDRVRGATKDIHSNTTDIEVTNAQTVKAFIGGGVTLGTDAEVNTSSESYVLWNWMMETAGSGSSNTDGTINTTSTLVDTNLGLSISTYTGTGANATIGHGLGVVPEFFMVKILDTGGTDWMVYHSALGATKNLVLNKTTSFSTSITRWNNTEPTSSLISLGTTTAVNGSGSTYVCYAFAPSQFISIGSYNGNGNANGTFIPTVNSLGIPIQPAWFMARSTGSGQDWRIVDNKRNPSNVNNLHLRANTTAADTSETNLDIDTGGIKIRTSSGGWNTSGTEYIYLAFGTPIIDVDGRIIGGR